MKKEQGDRFPEVGTSAVQCSTEDFIRQKSRIDWWPARHVLFRATNRSAAIPEETKCPATIRQPDSKIDHYRVSFRALVAKHSQRNQSLSIPEAYGWLRVGGVPLDLRWGVVGNACPATLECFSLPPVLLPRTS